MVILRKYNTATAAGTHIRIPIPKAGSTDFATGTDWTPAAGDVKVTKNGGAQANIGTLPAYSNGAWEFQLTATELSCKQLEIMVVDAAAKAIVDQCILIETFGNASAMYQADFSAAALPASLSSTERDAIADDVLTRGTSNVEAAVKAAPKCLGTMVIESTHKWKDDGAGSLKFADSADNYAGANALSRTIVATDSGLAPLKEVGGPA